MSINEDLRHDVLIKCKDWTYLLWIADVTGKEPPFLPVT